MNNGKENLATSALIAIIDDDQSVRNALSNLLHSAGYRTCDYDGAEAFLAGDCMRAADCAIMDVSLGSGSGFELQEHLIALQIALPVIFISGQGSRFAQERAAQLGAIAFLRKPINADILLTHVRRVIHPS